MKNKFPYESPEIDLIRFSNVDIMSGSGGEGGTTPPPETDWEDDNVMGDGWV